MMRETLMVLALAAGPTTLAGQGFPAPVLPRGPAASQALAIAADSSGHTLAERAAALRVLGRGCTRDALPLLTRLAQPYRRDWVIWHGALSALSACPFDELATFWRDMITFPRQPVRAIAMVGLLRTGGSGDMELIREVTHRETDPGILRLALLADSLLKLPPSARAASLR